MLKRVKVSNFKSWKELDLELGPVTGLFGSNSSGKSSLIQFLLMLKQTKESVDRSIDVDFGGDSSLVNLGSFRNIVHSNNINTNIEWSLEWELGSELKISDPEKGRQSVLFSGKSLGLSAGLAEKRGSVYSTHLTYRFSGAEFALTQRQAKHTEFELSCSNTDFRFKRRPGRAWTLPGPVKSYAFPDQAKTYFQNSSFLGDFEHSYEVLMDNIYYLGPLREYPKRQYTWSGARPRDVGLRGEKVIDAILAAGSNGYFQNLKRRGRRRPFLDIISYWLRYLGLADSFTVRHIADDSNLYDTSVQKGSAKLNASIVDVGFGVSQVLPVIVLLHYVPEGSIVMLEQPEIHLHPAVQSGLADIIIHAAIYRNVQVIVESHSEHFIRRLQRRVAEGESVPSGRSISADDIFLYFTEHNKGESTLKHLRLNSFGEIENWPKDFFGDEFGEIAAIKKAGLEKRIGLRD